MTHGAVTVQVWRGGWQAGTRDVAPEVPVALAVSVSVDVSDKSE